jgi:hypothetical protein
MSFGIYVREFCESKCYSSNTNVYPPSKYFPFPMKDMLYRSKKIKLDDYILCPLYVKQGNKGGDFQLGITGTVEEKEEFDQTLRRELGEEVGLIPKISTTNKKYKWKRIGRDTIDFVIYELPINDCRGLCQEDLENMDNIVITDNPTKKIGCYIYGNLQDVLKFLNSPQIYRFKSEDEIYGVVAIQVKIAKEIFENYN